MPPITREEAKKAIADQCGLEIKTRRIGRPHCEFSGFIFQLNLLGENRSGPKRAGFYYYSKEDLRDENAVVKPWLQDKLKDFGFSPEERRVRTNRSSDGREGHAADFYIDFPWDNPTDFAPIQSLYKRLRDFQKNVWEVMTEEERNKEIRQYNAKHRTEVRNYIKQRRGERPTDDEDDESEELSQDQDRVVELLKANLNVILTGAPGTGKTYTARQVAEQLVTEQLDTEALSDDEQAGLSDDEQKEAMKKRKEDAIKNRIECVQFHPGYDYSDFVVGMKPVLIYGGKKVFRDAQGFYSKKDETKEEYDETNVGERLSVGSKTEVSFLWEDGVFKKFADKARKAYDEWVLTDGHKPEDAPKFVFLIDEINRADLSRVFGELFSLLEEGYRYPNIRETRIKLPNDEEFVIPNEKETSITLPNGEEFVIPKNLYILGTMNDIDRSVESMDFALRRRFAWFEVKAEDSMPIIDKKVSDAVAAKKLKDAMAELNFEIAGEEVEKRKPTLELRLGSEYQLGGAIFAKYEKYKKDAERAFDNLWNNHIANILSEYLRGRNNRAPLLKELKEEVYDKKVKVDDTCVGSATDGNGEAKSSDKGSENTDKEA